MKEWIDGYDARNWQTTTEGTVRYALLGLGWWTVDVALPAIEDSDLGETTVLVSSSAEKAERVAREHGVGTGIGYDEFHDGAAAEEYDAVYVGTPNAYHLEYVETAADLGKAVLCEKPMEASVERAERMVAACEDRREEIEASLDAMVAFLQRPEHLGVFQRLGPALEPLRLVEVHHPHGLAAARLLAACEDAGVPLMVAYRMQTDPAVQRARELVADGFLGEPVSVYGTNSQRLLEMIPDPDQWRLDPDASGYGTSVMDLGIYSINTARYLLDRDPVAVQSRMHSGHEAFADVPDERSASLLVFEDDVEMVSTSSQRAYEDTHLKLTGTEGRIELRPAFHGECGLHLSRNDVSVDVRHDSFDAEREMREEFDYFADRVLTDADVHPDGRHGLADMRIIEAIHRAADTGERVEIRY